MPHERRDSNLSAGTTDVVTRILLCLGVAAGTLSRWDTLSHTWDPSYQAPALALGPTHTNYHAFREFMLSVGAVLVELYGVFQPAAKRTRPLWVAMCLTALFYYGGWWLPWPLFGLRTPNLVATIDHLIATILRPAGFATPSFQVTIISKSDVADGPSEPRNVPPAREPNASTELTADSPFT